MKTSTRIAGFVVGLTLIFGAAFGAGKLFSEDSANKAAAGQYVLKLARSVIPSGKQVDLSFSLRDVDGQPLTRYDVRHAKRLHLILVTKDFARFQHVHPTMAADGTWGIATPLDAGDWRVFADFQPHGRPNQVAHADLEVTGNHVSVTEEGDQGTSTQFSDKGVTVDAVGTLTAGGNGSTLDFEFSDAGGPITDLEPYLGSYGHLVVLRDSDMQYLHVHPEPGPSGPEVAFHVKVPTPGLYHLYLDFKQNGVVRTASFTLRAAAAAPGVTPSADPMDDMPGMDHGDH